jgi:hypothetical protein
MRFIFNLKFRQKINVFLLECNFLMFLLLILNVFNHIWTM